MNPFLHAPVALPAARSFYSETWRPAREPALRRTRHGVAALAAPPRRWARAIGQLAVAGGLALTAMPGHAVDANAASVEQLRTLNGVGPQTARIIVQERERGGPFESLEDLSDRVRGIGAKRLARLRAAGLTVGAGATVFSPATIAAPQFAPALPSATPVAP